MTDPSIVPEPRKGPVPQRVRVGLTGLGFVFLLVLLATAFLRMAGGPGVADNGTATPSANALDATPSEPLAQLGVAPGNTPPDAAATAAPARGRAPPRR